MVKVANYQGGDWTTTNFIVNTSTEQTTEKTTEKTTATTEAAARNSENPATGDSVNLVIIMALLVVSSAILVVFETVKKIKI